MSFGCVGQRGNSCRSLRVSMGSSGNGVHLDLMLLLGLDQIKAHQQLSTSPASPGAAAGTPEASAGHQHHTYTILCTPRITSLCRRVLEDLGVSGDVELREYRLEWIGLEDDLLSLELEDVAKDIYLVSPRSTSMMSNS